MTTRTNQQNKGLHKGCELLADALNDAGHDMKRTLKEEVDIPWNKETVKDYLFRPIMQAMFNKESTTELNTDEVSEVWRVLNRHTAQKLGVSVPFPSEEER